MKHPRYDVHPSVAYVRAILDNLPEKTGRSLDEWVRLVSRSGPDGAKARAGWLKKKHGLGGTTAATIARAAGGEGVEGFETDAYLAAARRYVETMYSGPREPLRPLHEALVKLGRSLGRDVRICPCQTMVPLYRNHVFAHIRPATRTRIDLGLALEAVRRKPTRRLIDTGGAAKGDRITHRIPIASLDEIDDEVAGWMRAAYEADV